MPARNDTNLLSRLLNRGDVVSIDNGRLIVVPGSGKPLPEGWLEAHSESLCREIFKATGQDAFSYDNYTTGRYGPHKAAGITLQFNHLITGQAAYVIFNVDLNRTRGPEKGKPLPRRRFRVGKRSHFYKFWLKTGLKLPDRLCHFHNYMGNLRQLILIGEEIGERLSAGTLQPLNLGAESIKRIVLAPTIHPNSTQHPPNTHPTFPPKESPEAQHTSTTQPDETTGVSNHGNTVIRDTGTREKVYPFVIPKSLMDQSVDEWLADYGE